MTDKDRLDWLEQQSNNGACPALVNDDAGRWAIAFDGMQNVPDPDTPIDIQTMFFIEAARWMPTIRDAIDKAMEAP